MCSDTVTYRTPKSYRTCVAAAAVDALSSHDDCHLLIVFLNREVRTAMAGEKHGSQVTGMWHLSLCLVPC